MLCVFFVFFLGLVWGVSEVGNELRSWWAKASRISWLPEPEGAWFCLHIHPHRAFAHDHPSLSKTDRFCVLWYVPPQVVGGEHIIVSSCTLVTTRLSSWYLDLSTPPPYHVFEHWTPPGTSSHTTFCSRLKSAKGRGWAEDRWGHSRRKARNGRGWGTETGLR